MIEDRPILIPLNSIAEGWAQAEICDTKFRAAVVFTNK